MKTKALSTLFSAALLLALTGCGSDPVTECISGDQALAALRTVYDGIEPCDTDANGATMIPGCSPGGILVEETYTNSDACAFKGPVSTCGEPPSGATACNVKGEFTVSIFHKEDGGSCDAKCFTPGQIKAHNTGISCNTSGTEVCMEPPSPTSGD